MRYRYLVQHEIQKHYTRWKQPVTRDQILYYSILWIAQNKQMHKDRKELSGYLGLRRGKHKWGATANGYGVSFWGDGNALESDTGDCCTTLWMNQNLLYTFKRINVMVGTLFLNKAVFKSSSSFICYICDLRQVRGFFSSSVKQEWCKGNSQWIAVKLAAILFTPAIWTCSHKAFNSFSTRYDFMLQSS